MIENCLCDLGLDINLFHFDVVPIPFWSLCYRCRNNRWNLSISAYMIRVESECSVQGMVPHAWLIVFFANASDDFGGSCWRSNWLIGMRLNLNHTICSLNYINILSTIIALTISMAILVFEISRKTSMSRNFEVLVFDFRVKNSHQLLYWTEIVWNSNHTPSLLSYRKQLVDKLSRNIIDSIVFLLFKQKRIT